MTVEASSDTSMKSIFEQFPVSHDYAVGDTATVYDNSDYINGNIVEKRILVGAVFHDKGFYGHVLKDGKQQRGVLSADRWNICGHTNLDRAKAGARLMLEQEIRDAEQRLSSLRQARARLESVQV